MFVSSEKVLCDIRLETDDGCIIYGHKVILASVCSYFRSMFSSFEESTKNHVYMRDMDSNALKSLVDYIYTAQIMITVDNAPVGKLNYFVEHSLIVSMINSRSCYQPQLSYS